MDNNRMKHKKTGCEIHILFFILYVCQSVVVVLLGLFVKANHTHTFDFGMVCQICLNGRNRNHRCLFQGEVIHPCADRGEVYSLAAVFGSKSQARAIAAGQQLRLVVLATVPYGAGGMNNELCRQIIALGNLCLTGLATVQRAAFFQQCGARSTMNRTVYTTAAQQPAICCIDNRIYMLLGNIAQGEIYIAEDTGSAIKGKKIDIYYDSHSAANNWGRRSIEVYVL